MKAFKKLLSLVLDKNIVDPTNYYSSDKIMTYDEWVEYMIEQYEF